MLKWFLVSSNLVYPSCGNIDCGINPSYRPYSNEQRVQMPSLEICQQVRHINPGSKCLGEQIDEEPQKQGSISLPNGFSLTPNIVIGAPSGQTGIVVGK